MLSCGHIYSAVVRVQKFPILFHLLNGYSKQYRRDHFVHCCRVLREELDLTNYENIVISVCVILQLLIETCVFNEPICVSSTFKCELEGLINIQLDTIFRHSINGVMYLDAVLLMTTFPIRIARCETSTIFIHPLPNNSRCSEQ
jgi:hypothetical protein